MVTSPLICLTTAVLIRNMADIRKMPHFVPDRLIGLAGSVRLGLGPRHPVRVKERHHPSRGRNIAA